MDVKEIMTVDPVTVDREETVAAAARLLSRYNIGALPVTGRYGRLVGILTDRDIAVRCVAAEFDPRRTQVRAVMSPGAVTVSAASPAAEALRTMEKHRVSRLPVTENGKLVGMVSRADLSGET